MVLEKHSTKGSETKRKEVVHIDLTRRKDQQRQRINEEDKRGSSKEEGSWRELGRTGALPFFGG